MNLKGYNIERTYSLFPSCVIDFDLSSHADIPVLLDIINETKDQCLPHALLENSISSYSMISILDEPSLVNLKNTMQMCIFDYAAIAGLEKIYITNNWYNVMGAGSKVVPHRHYSSTVSGAFYPLLEPGSSNLCFNSPIAQCKMHDVSDGLNLDNKFAALETEINIKEGHLYIFPSWLEHWVNVNNTNKRIAISFNTDRKRD